MARSASLGAAKTETAENRPLASQLSVSIDLRAGQFDRDEESRLRIVSPERRSSGASTRLAPRVPPLTLVRRVTPPAFAPRGRMRRMATVKLTTPVDEATIRSLHVGDTVSISGRLYTGRDAVHHRLHSGVKPPVDLEGQIIYHCGPVMVKEGDQWVCKAAGPTTSSREEPYEWEVMRDYKIRGVIGKGGMGPKTLEACQEYGAVYLHAIGGAAQVCAASIKRVDGVDWMDLGSPEAIWHLWVEDFMAIVTMDSHGQSLHKQVFEESRERLSQLKA